MVDSGFGIWLQTSMLPSLRSVLSWFSGFMTRFFRDVIGGNYILFLLFMLIALGVAAYLIVVLFFRMPIGSGDYQSTFSAFRSKKGLKGFDSRTRALYSRKGYFARSVRLFSRFAAWTKKRRLKRKGIMNSSEMKANSIFAKTGLPFAMVDGKTFYNLKYDPNRNRRNNGRADVQKVRVPHSVATESSSVNTDINVYKDDD